MKTTDKVLWGIIVLLHGSMFYTRGIVYADYQQYYGSGTPCIGRYMDR